MRLNNHDDQYLSMPGAERITRGAECLPTATQPETLEVPPECRPVQAYDDVLPDYRGTAIEELLAYHNLGAQFQVHSKAKLLVGMCMDFRLWLRIPPGFAYILRVGGANLRGLEFHISLAVANGVNSVCVIGHDQCAMSGMVGRNQAFVGDLVKHGGWTERDARNHFRAHAPHSDIGDVIGFVQWQASRLSQRYPRILVAPLFYSVTERALYQVDAGELK